MTGTSEKWRYKYVYMCVLYVYLKNLSCIFMDKKINVKNIYYLFFKLNFCCFHQCYLWIQWIIKWKNEKPLTPRKASSKKKKWLYIMASIWLGSALNNIIFKMNIHVAESLI